MEHLLYRSRASENFDPGQVFTIIQTSARRNPGRDVTGFLAFAHGTFVQLVEGPAEALDGLLGDLRNDGRHCELEVLERRPIERRRFPEWRMERLAVGDGDASRLEERLREAGIEPATIRTVLETYRCAKAA